MPSANVTLESLTRTIKLVQDRIKRDSRGTTGANEDRTRHALIDPMLKELGWSDPLVVTTQYLVRYGLGEYEYRVPDYALHPPDDVKNPIAFVEAKSMKKSLTNDHRRRLFEATKYARNKGIGIQYCILTNGDQWDLYKPDKGSYLRVFSLLISERPASECAQTFNDHFPKPPGLKPILGTPSPTPAIDGTPSDLPSTNFDLPKVLAYLTFFFVSSVVLGWIMGFVLTPPTSFSLVRTVVRVAFGLMASFWAAASIVLLFFQPKPKYGDLFKLIPLLRPISRNKPRTRFWIAVAVVGGIAVGGISGFVIGSAFAGFWKNISFLQLSIIILAACVVLWLPSIIRRLSHNKK